MKARTWSRIRAWIVGISVAAVVLLSTAWLAARTTVYAAPPHQTEIDVVAMVDVINRWHLGAFQGYKFARWIALGDVMRLNERIADGDLQVYLDPQHLNALGAAAAYEDCAGVGCSKYFNDIILADQPANVDPKTMWHESMHAIFDADDLALLVDPDEIYTWYMENSYEILNQVLTRYEDEYNKGEQCDQQKLDQYWSLFERRMQDAKSGQGFYGPITSDAQLQQLRQLTGFHVDPATIRANYVSLGMDKCVALTPTVQPDPAIDKSVILVIDASGSMDGTKIEEAKTAAKNVLGSMGAGQEVGLMVFYDCGSISWTPFSTDFASFVPVIDAIYAAGGTPLGASIRAAGGRMSQEASGTEGVIVVLTDGGESCGDNPVDAAATVYQMTLRRTISRVSPFSVPVAYADGGDILVSVVGFDIDDPMVEEQLRAIAEAGGGEFLTASNVDELNNALKRATGTGGLPSLLLLLGGGAACMLPLALLVVLFIMVITRRRRAPAPAPVAYAYGPPPPAPPQPAPQYSSQPMPYAAPHTASQYAPQPAAAPVPQGAVGAGELALLRGQAMPPGLSLSAAAIRIGRSAQGNHIVVQDQMVSSAHAEVYAQGGVHYIQDLRSTNGTFVNGARVVQPQALRDGDRIQLGSTEWVYRCGGGTVIMPRM